MRNGILWIVESKTAYTLDVLKQASRWPAHYRSVAVPSSKSERNYFVARDYFKVGVLEVGYDSVYETIKPPTFLKNHTIAQNMIAQLDDLHKTFAVAGSKSGNHITPYKRTMIEVKQAIKDHPGCSVKDLFDMLGTMHYANTTSFRGNLLKALESFEPWCKIDKSAKPYKLYVEEE